MEKPRIILTEDGSHTLFLPGADEHYHSHHGALQESRHVFIKNGLEFMYESGTRDFRIFEMGFGTGLNALLTLHFHLEHPDTRFQYTSIEAFPPDQETTSQLNFPEVMRSPELKGFFTSMHGFNEGSREILEDFLLVKHKTMLQEFNPNENFNLIYYDAFGPRVQPELWEDWAMKKVSRMLKPGGVFVTYCAQGAFKRNLKNAGFRIESLPGAPGKREMTRAVKNG